MYLYNSRAIAGLLVLAAIALILAFPASAYGASSQSGAEGTPVYGTATRQVDKKEIIRGLPNNDVDSLKKEKDGLKLAEVSFKVTTYDEDGLPSEYEAHVVYRGAETYQVLLYYETSETSGGSASGSGNGNDVTPVPVVITSDDFTEEEDIDEQEVSVSGEESDSEILKSFPENSWLFSPDAGSDENTEDDDSNAAIASGGSDGGGTGNPFSGLRDLFGSGSTPFSPAAFSSISPVGAASLITLASGAVIILLIVIQGKRRPRPTF